MTALALPEEKRCLLFYQLCCQREETQQKEHQVPPAKGHPGELQVPDTTLAMHRGSSLIWQILHTLLNILPGITYIYIYRWER